MYFWATFTDKGKSCLTIQQKKTKSRSEKKRRKTRKSIMETKGEESTHKEVVMDRVKR